MDDGRRRGCQEDQPREGSSADEATMAGPRLMARRHPVCRHGADEGADVAEAQDDADDRRLQPELPDGIHDERGQGDVVEQVAGRGARRDAAQVAVAEDIAEPVADLAGQVLPTISAPGPRRRAAGGPHPSRYLERPGRRSPGPTAGAVALAAGTARGAVAEAVESARERWHQNGELNAVRAEVAALIDAAGGAASLDELEQPLRPVAPLRRTSASAGAEPLRCYAPSELEASVAAPLVAAYAEGGPVLVASSPEAVEYARRLARAADALVGDAPPSPGRAEEDQRSCLFPEGAPALPPCATVAASRRRLDPRRPVEPPRTLSPRHGAP